MRTVLIAALALLAATSNETAAQRADSLVAGVRVRVTASAPDSRERYAGTLISLTPDSVTIGAGGAGTISVPVSAVHKFERSLGRSRVLSLQKGLKRGVIIGGAIGVLAGISAAKSPVCAPGGQTPCRKEGVSAGTMVLANTALFGTLGGIFGTTIGALFRSERWQEMSIGGSR